jgi:hypothetical protein
MNAVVALEEKPAKQAVRVVVDAIPILDTARFEHMQRIAVAMARMSVVPETLRMEGKKGDKRTLPHDTVVANCFMVVNQAVRWNMDPFAVAQSVSVVHGKLCYEGKLIAAVIDEKLGIRLRYEWAGKGEQMSIKVIGRYPDESQDRIIEGCVADWKTLGDGSPWKPTQYSKMLAYRGSREWARLHAPSIMLGVYSDDEMSDLNDNVRSNQARNITPPPPPDDTRARAVAPPAPAMAVVKLAAPPPPPPEEDAIDPEALFKEAEETFRSAKNGADLERLFVENYADLDPELHHQRKLTPPDWDHLVAMYERYEAKLDPA